MKARLQCPPLFRGSAVDGAAVDIRIAGIELGAPLPSYLVFIAILLHRSCLSIFNYR